LELCVKKLDFSWTGRTGKMAVLYNIFYIFLGMGVLPVLLGRSERGKSSIVVSTCFFRKIFFDTLGKAKSGRGA
jgi:hypothetical protein